MMNSANLPSGSGSSFAANVPTAQSNNPNVNPSTSGTANTSGVANTSMPSLSSQSSNSATLRQSSVSGINVLIGNVDPQIPPRYKLNRTPQGQQNKIPITVPNSERSLKEIDILAELRSANKVNDEPKQK